MTATQDKTRRAPHQFSAQGSRASHHNKALRNIGLPWQLPIADTEDVLGTGIVNQFGVGTLSPASVAAGGVWDNSAAAGSKITADLTDINDAGAADVPPFPGTEEAGDGLILGFSESGGVPAGLRFTYGGGTAGIGGTVTYKYLASNGAYKTFPKVRDGSAGLTAAAGTYDVVWQIPDDWVPIIETELSATVAYYIVKVEVATVYATDPVLDRVQGHCLAPGNVSGAFRAPATGLIDHISYNGTAGATNNDIILEVLNWTRGTRGLVTLTGNPGEGRFAFSTPLFVERGDELTIAAVQVDGTTEIENIHGVVLEIAL